MPGENLTRSEAIERAKVIHKVDSYDISLDVTTGPEVFRSETTVRFEAEPGASTFIDCQNRGVKSVVLNGENLDVDKVADDIRIQLPNLKAHNELTVVADMGYMNTGEGLHRFVDPVDNEVYLYTQFEVPDSRRVFTVFEQPDLKAEFTFQVTAPENWEVVSNEPEVSSDAAGDGKKTVRFGTTKRISSYITAIVAGPYDVVRDELTSADGRTIPLGVYSRKSLSQYLDADYVFDKTREGFEFYEKIFDFPYPFTKYDQLFVPEYNMGAMENAGCVTFTETYVFRSKVTDAVKERRVVTILHELAHMWFGDLVTMKWWNDLWLNESFAEYISTLATAEATEWKAAWTTFAAMEKSWAYRQDQLPSTHPIVAEINDLNDVQANFDGITYAKGASVLKQLVAWVGEKEFLAGVAKYFQKHQYGNTELKDLLVELEASSGRDLSGWSKKWLETAGVNTLRPEFEVDENGVFTSFRVLQSAVADYPTIRPHRLAIGLYSFEGDALARTYRVELDVDGESTEVPELVGKAKPDLVLLNDDDLAYAKIRLDEDSAKVAIDSLRSIDNPLARSLVWGAMWDATRDAEVKPSDFVHLVLANIASETESTTLRTVLGQMSLAARSYVAPERQKETVEHAANTMWALAQKATAGSDAQLQFVQAFAGLATTDEQLDILEKLHSGDVTLDGLTVDTDLAWTLLAGLAAGGRADDSRIDKALANDNTADGAMRAATARAAQPGLDAKKRAWASVFDETDKPNAIVRATAMGFSRAKDRDVLESFVSPYFDAIEGVWESRSYHIAEFLIEGFFPTAVASDDILKRASAWLDTHQDSPAALRRMVSEGSADVERTLKAQAKDSE